MHIVPLVEELTKEQQDLWRRVNELWDLSQKRDVSQVRNIIHPDYVGWDMSTDHVHDRNEAIQSVSGSAPQVLWYELHPLDIKVFESKVGIVHYLYSASIRASQSETSSVITGKWTETYLKQEGEWVMISVSGRPDFSIMVP